LAADRGIAFLDEYRGIINGDQIPWERYLKPQDKERVIPAESFAEEVKKQMLLGSDAEPGLKLPWEKCNGRVLVRKGTLVLWAGWSRHGKTRMLKQVMLHAIKSGERPLIASMEEDVRAVWKDLARMACATVDPSPREIDRFVQFIRGNLWLYDQQGIIQPKKLLAVVRYVVSELKVTQVMIDSLMMIGIPRDDYDGQHSFVNELHEIAMHSGATIHLVAHMRKRDGKNGEDSPGSLHDISGGQELGAIADSVFIVWRDLREKKEPSAPPVILKVEKQRGLIDWMGTLGLHFNLNARQFVEDVHPMRFWNEQGEDF
jgi:twinkle protein